jgi:hypothetical protein
MKTKIVALAVTIFLAHAAMAQFHIGVKAGANINKIDGKSFKDEFNYGYHLGGFAEIGLGDKFGLQPEVLFNQISTKTDSSFRNVYNNAFADRQNIKLNYLSIPVMLTYKFAGEFLTLQAGPQFGILMNKEDNLLENGKEAFKHGDFSMAAGAQIKVLKFRLTGRYVVGLNNINDIGDQNKWKNQGFQISAGIAL